MAPTAKEAAAQDPIRLEHFASKLCRQRTPVASRATQRRPGAEINTRLQWGIVTEYQKLLGDRSRVPPGGLKSLQLPISQAMMHCDVKWGLYEEQRAEI